MRCCLQISVERLDRCCDLSPRWGWSQAFAATYEIAMVCTRCGVRLSGLELCAQDSVLFNNERVHIAKYCTSQDCQSWGTVRVLKIGGASISQAGCSETVMEVEVNGDFMLEVEVEDFDFDWICKKDTGENLGPFRLENGCIQFDNGGEVGDAGGGGGQANANGHGHLNGTVAIIGVQGFFRPSPVSNGLQNMATLEDSPSDEDIDIEN